LVHLSSQTAVEQSFAPEFQVRNLGVKKESFVRVFVKLDDQLFCSEIDHWISEDAPTMVVRVDFDVRHPGEQPARVWVALGCASGSRVALYQASSPLRLNFSPNAVRERLITQLAANAPRTKFEINAQDVASDMTLPDGADVVINAQGAVAARTRLDTEVAQASRQQHFASALSSPVQYWLPLVDLGGESKLWPPQVVTELIRTRWLRGSDGTTEPAGALEAAASKSSSPAPQSLTLKPSSQGVGGPLGGIRLVAGPCLDVGRPAQPHDARTPNYLPVAFSEVHDGSMGPGDSASSFAAFRIARDAHDGFGISARADKSVKVAWVVNAAVWERALATGSFNAQWDDRKVLVERATRLEVGNRIVVSREKLSRRVDRVSAIPLAWRVSAISSVGMVLQLESLTTLHRAGHAPETLFFVDRHGPPSPLASEPAGTFPEFWLSEAGEWMITGPRTQGGPDVEPSTSLNGKGALPADVARWLGGAYRIVS